MRPGPLLQAAILWVYLHNVVKMLSQSFTLASSPGHSQILSRSRGEKSGCEIKSGSGLGTRLHESSYEDILQSLLGSPSRSAALEIVVLDKEE